MDALRGFHPALRACFPRQEPRDPFCHDMVGQCSPRARQSSEPLALQGAGGKVRALQRCVRAALWDAAALREPEHRWGHDAMGEPDGVRLLAATGLAKKGQASVGVARPYGGALGTGAHGQGGVCAAHAARQGYAWVDKRRCRPEPWCTAASHPWRTKGKGPAAVVWQSHPPWAAAMGQERHPAGSLPCKDIVADCRAGHRPDLWAAGAAGGGTVAFVATPVDTWGWLPPLATTTPPSTSQGA
jgi:SRSO17 transposase